MPDRLWCSEGGDKVAEVTPAQILLLASPTKHADYHANVSAALDALGIEYVLSDSIDPPLVDYILYAPNNGLQDFSPFTRCKAVFNLWAGVERVVNNPTLEVPLARMVDPGLTQGMVEWVTGHVLRYHLGLDQHIMNHDAHWMKDAVPPLAQTRIVTFLGLGQLGLACAAALKRLGFTVRGWSQSPKNYEGIESYQGAEQLLSALDNADFAVLLLPNTPHTENIFDAQAMSVMKRGAFVLNPGRGALLDETDLIQALDAGQLAHATLDVFRQEPLPREHAFWSHPKITVTPHLAAETRAETSAPVLAENIRRAIVKEPLLNLVDRVRGY